MLIIQVNHVDSEPLEARVARLPDVVGVPVHAAKAPVRAPDVSKFRGDYNPLAPLAHNAADEFLIGANAVHVGRVEEGDTKIDRAVECRDGLDLVAVPIKI